MSVLSQFQTTLCQIPSETVGSMGVVDFLTLFFTSSYPFSSVQWLAYALVVGINAWIISRMWYSGVSKLYRTVYIFSAIVLLLLMAFNKLSGFVWFSICASILKALIPKHGGDGHWSPAALLKRFMTQSFMYDMLAWIFVYLISLSFISYIS